MVRVLKKRVSMKCIKCNSIDTRVIESRDVSEGIATRRRRECEQCQARFTTYERAEQPHIVVIKRDGNRELFNRDKLLKGIQRATEKTRVTTVDLELIVASIEAELQSLAEPEVYSKEIGELVMQRLSVLDEVAYVRFASVYRQFKDIASFERELLRIKQSKKSNN